jgi:hypothetical protein
MLSGLLSAAFGKGRRAAVDPVEAAPQPPCGPRKPAADPEWWSSSTTYKCSRPQGGFGAQVKTYRRAAALLDLRRLFLLRGVNVRDDGQLLAAVEDVCRELDAIKAQVGERLLRDMGLESCGTPGSDEPPGWIGHDDDD